MDQLMQLVETDASEADLVRLIRDALGAAVVLDTWMNGEHEEEVFDDALDGLAAALATRLLPGLAESPAGPGRLDDALAALHEIVLGTALYHAQRTRGRRAIDRSDVDVALDRVEGFGARQPLAWEAPRILYGLTCAHEDLNALAYYGSMRQDDFLMGRLHRPWSDRVFHGHLTRYRRLGLVDVQYRGEGDTVMLTSAGHALLERLRYLLEASGEFAWRADAQRWTIFGELDYDAVLPRVAPDGATPTVEFLNRLGIRPGMRVLEVGCGTGRATIDLGLYQRVGESGHLVALDPSRTFLDQLEAKRRAAGIRHVEVVQGAAEHLPFPDDAFDVCLAVGSLHFTEVDQAVGEMARVTKPGGLVAALCPPPQTDFRQIPMVALWFRPLAELAEKWGLPFGERTGLPPGVLEATFRRHLASVTYTTLASTLSAADPEAFLAFVLKGGAFYQNLLCRVPYADRWKLIHRLEQTGHALVQKTTLSEQTTSLDNETVFGRVPEPM